MSTEKTTVRTQMRARLRALAPERDARSAKIASQIAAHPAYSAAKIVATFDPLPSEPAVDLLWEVAPRRFVFPIIAGEHLQFAEVRSAAELHQIATRAPREPRLRPDESPFGLAEVDVILVPGLAFTAEGWRLGRGGGYYDRLLASLPAHASKLGVCFAEQVLATLPCEAHDIPMDAVIAG